MSTDDEGAKYLRYGRSFLYWVGTARVHGRKQWRFIVLGPLHFGRSFRRTVAFGRFHAGRVVIEGGVLSPQLRDCLRRRYRKLRAK